LTNKFKVRLAALENRFAPPDPGLPAPRIISQLVGVRRDHDANLLGPNLDFTQAEIGERVFRRRGEETLERFEGRVLAELHDGGVSEVRFTSSDTIEDG
jgi:hypothetical protein